MRSEAEGADWETYAGGGARVVVDWRVGSGRAADVWGGGGARETGRDDGVGVEGGRGGEEAHARAGTRGGGTETKIGRVGASRIALACRSDVGERDESARKKSSAARTPLNIEANGTSYFARRLRRRRTNCARRISHSCANQKWRPAAARFRDFLTDAPHDERRVKLREELLRWHRDKPYFSLCREDELEDVKVAAGQRRRAKSAEAFKAVRRRL